MIAATLFNNSVELFVDDDGIDRLIRDLQRLRGRTAHIHNMTPSWGGEGLAEKVHHGELVNHFVIYANYPN